jgi:2'-5' RNA ligase
MRLFIAVDIEDRKIISEISKIQNYLIENGVKGTFPNEKQLHITIKFLGETPDYKTNYIIEKLRTIKFNPTKIILRNIDGFPNLSRPRVVVVRVDENKELLDLFTQVEKHMTVLGYRKETRPFKPHITIARVKKPWSWRRDLVSTLKNIYLNLEYDIKCFKLKNSTLTPTGPIYQDIEIFCYGDT